MKVFILKEVSKVVSGSAWPWEIICKDNTLQIGDRLYWKNTLCTLCFKDLGFHVKPIFFCNILVLPSRNSDSCRRYTLKCLCWCVQRKVGELVQTGGSKWGLPWGLLCGTSGRGKLCMVPCHSCHIYGIWRSKEVGDSLKSSFGVAMQATRKENFYGKGDGGRGQKCNKVYDINTEL